MKQLATLTATLCAATLFFALPPGLTAQKAEPQLSRNGPRPEVEGAYLVLERWGFVPNALVLSSGKIAITVVNRVGKEQLDLLLELEVGGGNGQPRSQLRAASFNREYKKWNEEFTLPAGEYYVRETSNPDWSMKITVIDDK